MYCSNCGTQITLRSPFCSRCGTRIVRPAPQDLGESATIRALLPVGRSGLAIAAGYLGIFSIVLLPAPLVVLFGILAVRDIRKNPKKHGMGRAVFGIVMGVIGTCFGLYLLLRSPR